MRVVVLVAIDDGRRAAKAGNLDLQGSDETGMTTGDLVESASEQDAQSRLCNGVAKFVVQRLAKLDRALALVVAQFLPVTLPEREEARITALGRKIHPCIAEGAILVTPVPSQYMLASIASEGLSAYRAAQ